MEPPGNHANDVMPNEEPVENNGTAELRLQGNEGPDPTSRMTITDTERGQALAIKAAIEADPEIDNLCDFWYAQMALVHGDKIEEALSQAAGLQGLRQEYKITDTMSDAKRTIWDDMHIFESDRLLSFSYTPNVDGYSATIDLAAVDKRALQTHDRWRDHIAGQYYFRQALNPDLQSISNGVTVIVEFQGFEWRKSGGISYVSRMMKEVASQYPSNIRHAAFYHAGVLARLTHSAIKPFLPQQFLDKVTFGFTFPERLDSFLLVPTPKEARLRNFARMMAALKTRYDNESSFRL